MSKTHIHSSVRQRTSWANFFFQRRMWKEISFGVVHVVHTLDILGEEQDAEALMKDWFVDINIVEV